MDDIRAGHEPQITWECISGAVPALTPFSAMRALVSLGAELLDPLGTRDRAQSGALQGEQLSSSSSVGLLGGKAAVWKFWGRGCPSFMAERGIQERSASPHPDLLSE